MKENHKIEEDQNFTRFCEDVSGDKQVVLFLGAGVDL